MTNNAHTHSLSQTSDEDNSSDHSPGSFATLSCGGSIVGPSGARGHPSHSNPPPPPPATTGYYIIQEEDNMNDQPQQVLELDTPSKRPRGRPLGSKNKPKPPIVIRQESEDVMKPVVIEIPTGNDVIEALLTFARLHRVNISALSGSGSVTDISLRHHVSCASIFPIHGTYRILSLTGTYFGVCFPSLTSSNLAAFPPCSSFGIIIAGPQGQVFGGVIGGRVVAATTVVVMATVFKNPEFHRLSVINGNIVDEEGDGENDDNNNNAYVSLINVDHSGGVNIVPSGNTKSSNNAIVMMPNMSVFGVTTSVDQLNGQAPIANMNVMQQNPLNRLP